MRMALGVITVNAFVSSEACSLSEILAPFQQYTIQNDRLAEDGQQFVDPHSRQLKSSCACLSNWINHISFQRFSCEC
jgi:hypothetical protein